MKFITFVGYISSQSGDGGDGPRTETIGITIPDPLSPSPWPEYSGIVNIDESEWWWW